MNTGNSPPYVNFRISSHERSSGGIALVMACFLSESLSGGPPPTRELGPRCRGRKSFSGPGPDGTVLAQERGTPQGSAISPDAGEPVHALCVRRLARPESSGRAVRALCRRPCATNAEGGCDVEARGLRMRCGVGDGGGPSGIALQGEVSNHRDLLRSSAVVVGVAEKAPVMAPGGLREGERK